MWFLIFVFFLFSLVTYSGKLENFPKSLLSASAYHLGRQEVQAVPADFYYNQWINLFNYSFYISHRHVIKLIILLNLSESHKSCPAIPVLLSVWAHKYYKHFLSYGIVCSGGIFIMTNWQRCSFWKASIVCLLLLHCRKAGTFLTHILVNKLKKSGWLVLPCESH